MRRLAAWCDLDMESGVENGLLGRRFVDSASSMLDKYAEEFHVLAKRFKLEGGTCVLALAMRDEFKDSDHSVTIIEPSGFAARGLADLLAEEATLATAPCLDCEGEGPEEA